MYVDLQFFRSTNHQDGQANIKATIKLFLWDTLLHAAPITNSPVCSQHIHANNLFYNDYFLRCIIAQKLARR